MKSQLTPLVGIKLNRNIKMTENVKVSKTEELKQIQAQAKEARERAKAIKAELDAGKEDRKKARKDLAQARKNIDTSKSTLRGLTAQTYNSIKSGDSDAVKDLANEIMEAATALVGALRVAAEAIEEIEGL